MNTLLKSRLWVWGMKGSCACRRKMSRSEPKLYVWQFNMPQTKSLQDKCKLRNYTCKEDFICRNQHTITYLRARMLFVVSGSSYFVLFCLFGQVSNTFLQQKLKVVIPVCPVRIWTVLKISYPWNLSRVWQILEVGHKKWAPLGDHKGIKSPLQQIELYVQKRMSRSMQEVIGIRWKPQAPPCSEGRGRTSTSPVGSL